MPHFLQFIKHLKKTGAVAPSSRFLAKDLVHQLRHDLSAGNAPPKPVRILEIGPGTGVLTKQIIRYLRPEDHFDVVEIHEHFYRMIERKFASENVHVHHNDFLKFITPCKYDYIFSSLPYESLPTQISRQIWEKKLDCCNQNAYISYYKYLNFKSFRCTFEEQVVKKYQCDHKLVFLNLPPAQLFTLEVHQTPAMANGAAQPV